MRAFGIYTHALLVAVLFGIAGVAYGQSYQIQINKCTPDQETLQVPNNQDVTWTALDVAYWVKFNRNSPATSTAPVNPNRGFKVSPGSPVTKKISGRTDCSTAVGCYYKYNLFYTKADGSAEGTACLDPGIRIVPVRVSVHP